jgi:hypothetical protein
VVSFSLTINLILVVINCVLSNTTAVSLTL